LANWEIVTEKQAWDAKKQTGQDRTRGTKTEFHFALADADRLRTEARYRAEHTFSSPGQNHSTDIAEY
jgi:hypothetical protein